MNRWQSGTLGIIAIIVPSAICGNLERFFYSNLTLNLWTLYGRSVIASMLLKSENFHSKAKSFSFRLVILSFSW